MFIDVSCHHVAKQLQSCRLWLSHKTFMPDTLPFMVLFCLSSVLINGPEGFPGLIWPFILYDLLLSFSPPADRAATPQTLSFSLVYMSKRQREGVVKG